MSPDPKRVHIRYVLAAVDRRQETYTLLQSGLTYQEILYSLEWVLDAGLVAQANASLELTELGRRFLAEPSDVTVRISRDPLAIGRRVIDEDVVLLPADDVE